MYSEGENFGVLSLIPRCLSVIGLHYPKIERTPTYLFVLENISPTVKIVTAHTLVPRPAGHKQQDCEKSSVAHASIHTQSGEKGDSPRRFCPLSSRTVV